jgi:twitching motility protein PilT
MISSSEGISDLLFAVGKPPVMEDHGILEEFPIDTPTGVLDSTQIDQIADHVMQGDERLKSDLATHGSCDCSYALADVARMRINIFKQNGRPAIVMRKLQTEIPTLDKLGLPPIFRDMIKEKNGIIFITGATGSGKTTTLAAMLNELNGTQKIHILTLEDPIEFLHPHKQALFNQRQLGKDFRDFASGLRAALRQAPKVILVGEIRDRETMEIAMTASETGHIVFTTMHTINAGQTINRILGMFSKEEEQQLRQRLADTIRYIVSQRLVSQISGGRLLVSEIMGSSLRTRETMLYGESENRTFQEIIEAGDTLGWHSFDQSLLKAYKADLITDETALIFCAHKNKMRRDIDMVKKLRNLSFEEPSGLRLDADSEPKVWSAA